MVNAMEKSLDNEVHNCMQPFHKKAAILSHYLKYDFP